MTMPVNLNRPDNALGFSGGASRAWESVRVPVKPRQPQLVPSVGNAPKTEPPGGAGIPSARYMPTEFWSNRGAFFNGDGDSVELDNRLSGKGDGKLTAEEIQKLDECQTCKNRKYADQSDDTSVSFQTPTKLNPSTAAAKVAAHENEHVMNERADAEREGRKVISQTVTMHYAICPECGTSYVAGGQTRTVTTGKHDEEEEKAGQEQAEAEGRAEEIA